MSEAADDIADLCSGWTNERLAPELLPYLDNLVYLLKGRIRDMQAQVDSEIKNSSSIQDRIRQLEIDRLQYLLSSYLRTRLQKIEKNVFFFALNEEARRNLSEAETAFVDDFGQLLLDHYKVSFLQELPPRLQDVLVKDDPSEDYMPVEAPNADVHVFLRMKSTLGVRELDNRERDSLRLEKDDIVLSRYSLFRSLVESGDAELV